LVEERDTVLRAATGPNHWVEEKIANEIFASIFVRAI
jgi:hypothetical protein